MYEEIDETLIKQTLGQYEEISLYIHSEMKRTCRAMANRLDSIHRDELIEAASLPTFDDFGGKVGSTPSDLFATYERYKQLEREQAMDAARYLMELTSKQETINRIMTCVQVLPDEEQQVLWELYGPGNNYSSGCIELTSKTGMSLPTLKRVRRLAMSHVKELYQTKYTQTELYRFDIVTHSLRSYR